MQTTEEIEDAVDGAVVDEVEHVDTEVDELADTQVDDLVEDVSIDGMCGVY